MDKKKQKLMIGIAVLIVGGFLVFNMTAPVQQAPVQQAAAQQRSAPAPVQYMPVVFAKKDIVKGSLILEEMVKMKNVPANTVKEEDLTSLDYAVGKVSTVDIVVGERVTKGRVMVRPSEAKLSKKVPDGKRAVTIPIDALASLEGMIKPGDRVDVVGNFPFQQKQPVIVAMFEDVLVLAVGRVMAEYAAQGGYKSITMALAPEEAHLLLFATQIGKLTLLLRSPLDSKKARVNEPITMDKLWSKLFNISEEQKQEAAARAMEVEAQQRAQQEAQQQQQPQINFYSGGKRN